jgi:hypothetical protein
MVLALEAFAEDCARAAVVVSVREAMSPNCVATLVDRNVWRTRGAVALRWMGDRFEQAVTLPPDYDRPWGHGSTNAATDSRLSVTPPISSDATPRPDDLGADD